MSEELERAYAAIRWIYQNGMKSDRPKAVSDVCNEAFASYRGHVDWAPEPRPDGMDTPPPPSLHREPIEADRKLADEIYNALRDEGWFPASRVAQMITAHRLAISRSATADSIAATIIAPGTTAEQLRNFIAAAVRDDRVTPALPLPKAREGDHG